MGIARSSFIVAVLGGVAVLAACGDTTTVVGGAPPAGTASTCDSTKCLPGNTCLPLGGEIKCRKTCGSNDDPATSCPLGYICTDTNPGEGVAPFCIQTTAAFGDAANRTPVTPKPEGQWGTSCLASLGAQNPACDVEQGFYCHALSPSDGNAYCTTFGCETDTDCGAGFGCESVNSYPNANTSKRKEHGASATQRACIRRAYCATCTSDIDCPAIAGVKQHCIGDSQNRSFCTPECSGTGGCPTEAKCATYRGNGAEFKVCFPRAGACIGDGTLCAPCRSDVDCGNDGTCTKGEYSTERFCAKAAPGGDCKQCPKDIPFLPDRPIGCSNAETDKLPLAYCAGLVSIDGRAGADIGCFTPDR